jgi:hypothetical protein
MNFVARRFILGGGFVARGSWHGVPLMSDCELSFEDWLAQADLPASRLTAAVLALLQAAFRFRQHQGTDYYSRRLLSHLLLHCDCGLKVAQVARLTGFGRATASRHQGLSSKEVIQATQRRLVGRPYGKLLPRFAGPVAQFLCDHPQATHYDTLDFLERVLGTRVSLQALHTFLNTYGLDRATRHATPGPASHAAGPTPDPDGPDPPNTRVPATLLSPPAPGQPIPLPPPVLHFATTQYAGAFLLLPQALRWHAVANDCFADDYGTLRRGLLTSLFAPLVGLGRIFHLDAVNDTGFAWLTGGLTCPSRYPVGGWRRHLSWHEVDAFCRRTAAWDWIEGEDALVSFDDHVIPRWTRKFRIPKGYSTTRNKHMRCEKLFFGYDVVLRRFLCVRATPGDVGLRDLSMSLTRRVLREGRPRSLHALFDAAAGKSDADVRALWDLVEEEPTLTVTLRACRYPTRVAQWKQLPSGLFVAYEEPGPYVGAPAKEIRLAETRTTLREETDEEAVRTIICRELVPGPKKDRWHPLQTTSATAEPVEILRAFRQRQHHEQGYRVGVHDLFLDAAPCGYDKESPDPTRPRWHRGPLQMMGWLAALLYNAMANLALSLPEQWWHAQVGTLRRLLINRPGQLYVTEEALIVYFDRFRGQEMLVPLIDEVNEQRVRLPWLGNRRLVLSLMPVPAARAGPCRSILDN